MVALRVLLAVLTSTCVAAECAAQAGTPPQAPDRAQIFLVTPAAALTPSLAGLRSRLRDAVLARDAHAFEVARAALAAHRAAALDRMIVAINSSGGQLVGRTDLFGVAIAALPPGAEAALRADELVDAVLADATHAADIGRATDNQNHAVDLVQSTHAGYRGAGACLVLLDSGIDASCGVTGRPHPAFDRFGALETTRIRSALSSTPDPNDREDQIGHGTAIAAIAIARDWIAGSAGDDGFAPDATLLSIKITRGAAAVYRDSDLVLALDEVARQRLSGPIPVATLCWGGQPNPIHSVQRALDELAADYDVLIVASAGNAGLLPNPAAQSCGFTNGIAVAAVHPDAHVVWSSSSSGPLPLDPLRTWPDIAAVGVDVQSAQIDDPDTPSTPLSGTSFAAPMVAGTALVLRAAEPSLTTLETRAILLGATANIAASNPAANRFDYGMGLLRTDLAVEALRTGSRTRGRATFAVPDLDIPLENATIGHSYVATLAWHRSDVATNDLDDLDLVVLDPSGLVVAASESRRNLYERVVFEVRAPGSYTLAVRGHALLHDGVDWALVSAESLGGLRQEGAWEPFGAGCDGQGIDPQQGIEFPTIAAGRFANNHTPLPLAGAPSRVLQILDGSVVPDGFRVEQLAFRRDDSNLTAPTFTVDLEIRMGHTTRAPTAVVPEFERNFDGEPVTVFARRQVRLEGVVGLVPDAGTFDYVIELDSPFVAHTANGQNLVVEFRSHGHDLGSQSFGLDLDAELGLDTALVAAIGDPNAPTGQPDPLGISMSLLSGSIGVLPPVLTTDRAPQLGTTMQLAVRNAPPGSMAALVHGADASSWGPFLLPAAFDPIAAPGCALMVRPDVLLSTGIGANGQGVVPVAIPNDPTFLGAVFYQQFLVLDRAANPLGLTATGAARARVGG